MQHKCELRARLTYLWQKSENKLSLNFIFVLEPLRFQRTHPSFLLSGFASRVGLIQSAVGVGCWSRGPGVSFPGSVSRGPGSGLRVSGSWFSVLGSRVSNPDFRLCCNFTWSTVIRGVFGANSGFRVLVHYGKGLISVFQDFFATIGKILILPGDWVLGYYSLGFWDFSDFS